MNLDEQASWASRLEAARTRREPIQPLTDTEPALTVEQAYAIARFGVDLRLANGSTVVGHKIGLTSVAVQQQLGVDQPDYGTLLDDMLLADESLVPSSSLISPKVELELAFRLAEPLIGPGITVNDVQQATESVQAAIEIVDSRIADWRIRLPDTIADNASSGAFVLSEERVAPDAFDLSDITATLSHDGVVIEQGRSDAVLGDPRSAVAWLANAIGALGTTLRAGDVVLSGACTRMVSASSGGRFVGDFGPLGQVSVSFGHLQ